MPTCRLNKASHPIDRLIARLPKLCLVSSMSRFLTDEEISFVLSGITAETHNKIEKRLLDGHVSLLSDELTTLKVDSSKDFDKEAMRRLVIEKFVDSSSLLGDSMIRSSQNASKTITQTTISSKRGTEGKSQVSASASTMKSIKAFSEVKQIVVYTHPSQGIHEFDDCYTNLPSQEYEKLAKSCEYISLKRVISKITPISGRTLEISLLPQVIIEYRILPSFIVGMMRSYFQDFLVTERPFHEFAVHLTIPKDYSRSIGSASKTIMKVADEIRLSGIWGVRDVRVVPTEAKSPFSPFYRVIGKEGRWRCKLNVAAVHNSHVTTEMAMMIFSEYCPKYEYDDDFHYFYVDSLPSKDLPSSIVGNVIAMCADSWEVVDKIYQMPEFDHTRTISNDRWAELSRCGVEHGFQWAMFELRALSGADGFEYHTHHPLIERMFSLGYPTPVTEKGNSERYAGTLASVTFSKGENTMRKAAIRQAHDKNNNIYSSHKIGSLPLFGSSLRVGKHPYVGIYREIAEENQVAPHRGAITERFIRPAVSLQPRDYAAAYGIVEEVREIDLSPIVPNFEGIEADIGE